MLCNLIGQERMRGQLEIWLRRCMEDKRPFPHVLFTGPPGVGKTTFMRAVAEEMGDCEEDNTLLEIDLSRYTADRLVDTLVNFPGGTILLDEIHQAKKSQQDYLLQAMEEASVTLRYGSHYELEPITFCAGTTHPEQLDPAFASRFALHFELAPYSDEEMTQIVIQMVWARDGEIDPRDARILGAASLGIPRTARHLVEAWWALRPDGTAEDALRLVGVEEDGLSTDHLRYLRTVRQITGAGTIGERPLTNILRMHPTTLAQVERVLIERGYIRLTPTGRILTSTALKRLKEGAA